MRRDANKDFEASKIKLWHVEAAGPVLNIGNDNQTQTLNIGNGSGVQTINMGNNGTGTTAIKLGGGSDAVQVNLPLKDVEGRNILNATMSSNTLVGIECMRSLGVGSSTNVAVGSAIGYNATTAQGNVYIGHQCGTNAGNVNFNTAVGNNALLNVASHDNTAVGQSALHGVTTGTWNVGVGRGAGSTVVTGSHNTLIGRNANTATANISNSAALGSGAIVEADNTIQLGNTAVTLVKTSGNVLSAPAPTMGDHLTNKLYVDSRVPATSQETWTSAFTGPLGLISAVTFLLHRHGNVITITNTTTVSSGAIHSDNFKSVNPLPAIYRPSSGDRNWLIGVYNGSTDMILGQATVASDGFIRMFPANGNFSPAGIYTSWRAWSTTFIATAP